MNPALPPLTLVLLLAAAVPVACQTPPNLLKNPSLTEFSVATGIPIGWYLYAGAGHDQQIARAETDKGPAMLLADGDTTAEIGISQATAAQPNLNYEASAAAADGAFLQLRFLPSQKWFQVSLATSSEDDFETISVAGVAPADTTRAVIYLYSHAETTPRLLLRNARLVAGGKPTYAPPPPVPPVYDKLKDLHLTTDIVQGGEAQAAIVAPATPAYALKARELQASVEKLTGVRMPIVSDTSPEAAIPYGDKPGAKFPDGEDVHPDGLKSNLIILGNRSTNKAADTLYNLYYTLTDLKYPGPDGFEVRTLHNPFGDGRNIILLGCSDDEGLGLATRAFIADLNGTHPTKGELSVGRLMEIGLGRGVQVPQDLKQFETWEASKGYGSSGYFGWNCISKRMAMYYMTGDPFQAREAIRLAFPDAQAMKDIDVSDGEMIENKHDPLAGPYHYNAHMMILFWDLIEESPVFTDEERLKVTNAFARQLNHRKDEGIYGLTTVPTQVGSRHGQYAAISLYCLGRYFERYYPADVWRACVEGPKLSFAPLHKTAFVDGENDNLFWYNTAHAPILTYMVLSGDREPLKNGVLATLLRGQEAIISGRVPDWALNSAALDFLHKAAYLTDDGRWLRYRERAQMDTHVFRLGQSFWPDEKLQPHDPTDLIGQWTFHPLPKPYWRARGSGLPFSDSFFFGSFRSAQDASGDFVLLSCYNGASRNPYHTFDILELRLNGRTLLQNYHNQVLTCADGMVEPVVPMDAALRYADVVGDTAIAVGEVPNAAFCNWRRSLLQRTGRYALIVDDLAFRTDSENMTVQTTWEPVGGAWDTKENAIRIGGVGAPTPPAGWLSFRALETACTSNPAGPQDFIRLDGLEIMLLRANKPGAWVEMPFKLAQTTTGEAFVELVNYLDRGTVRLYLDGRRIGADYDSYAAAATTVRLPLGKTTLTEGTHRLRVETVASHAGTDKCFIGLGGVLVRPQGTNAAPTPTGYDLHPSDLPMAVRSQDGVMMEWRGPVKQGEHRIQFSLLAATGGTPDSAPACVRIADNAAALALPEPALAVVGQYEGVRAEVAVMSAERLVAKGLTTSEVLTSTRPVDVNWDFPVGTIAVHTTKEAVVALVTGASAGAKVDGKPDRGQLGPDGLRLFKLAPGKHVFTGITPDQTRINALLPRLNALLQRGKDERVRLLAAIRVGTGVLARPPSPGQDARGYAWSTSVGGKVVDTAVMPSPAGTFLAVAEGKTVHVLTADGKELRKLETDGPIRVLRYWPEAKLLLVGCTDEKVIAFDEAGNRKWVFVSQMDPAVYEAAKQYWFKSAPGLEGIHGLYSGVFLGGKSQAFVGSACTLEILDESGQLVKRLPVFWGPGHKFQIVAGPGGSLNLLIAREPTDGHALAIINNKTLDPTPRGYDGVPAGHTYVNGWACMSRDHILNVDLYGDGKKEIVSAINGTWNRVTVWSGEGQALYNAQFGPGDAIPARNMRGLDAADLDGDGKLEIVTATSAGLLVALTGKCEKLWSKQLPSPATVLKCAGKAIVVGCENGAVLTFDGKGKMRETGQMTGAPTRVEVVGGVVVMGTDKGEVIGFQNAN